MKNDLAAKSQEVEKSKDPILRHDNSLEQRATPVNHTTIDLEDLKENKTDIDTQESDIDPELEQRFPVKNWERFEFKKLLGAGGMGLVYQAWDAKLSRMVALKFLRNSLGQTSKRFLQEARAQCRIEHDNVCKVYEAGEVENMPYIAMQYIEGQTLRLAYKEMSLEEKVQVMRDIAKAIHAAHRLGIIHRDIKPDNIMLTKSEDGKWHPIVMDFGLAKEVGNKGLTQTGALMGTPAYMSPEQARGQIELLDRRTDVYSLGAMFYSILVGKAPFQGSSPMEVVLKVINDDAQSISQIIPSVPKDLNTIIMKCLEKDPKQRYESAQSFAQDLQCYLDGDPISVRATSWYGFLWKKARKHKAIVIISSIALILVLTLSALSLWTWLESSRKVALERQMAEQAEKVESMMRFVSLTAPHNITEELKMAEQEIEIIKKQMAQAGNLAKGPGNYALGRSYLALSNYEKARQHLEIAYNTGFRTPNLDLALGQVLGEFYRRELDNLPQTDDPELNEDKSEQLDKQYLQPIQFHLNAYLSAKSKKSTQEAVYLEGLLALYKKDYQAALKRADEAIGQSSWYYEPYLLKGDIYLSWGQEKSKIGDKEEAANFLLKAEEAFQQASKIGPSNLQANLGVARKSVAVLDFTVYSGESIEEAFDKAIKACDVVLALDPTNSQACLFKSRSYTRLGESQAKKNGQDPTPKLQQAIYWAEKALESNPDQDKVYRSLGSIYRILGKYALDHGDDPHILLDLAIANLEKAIELKPDHDSAYSSLGIIYRSKAQYEEKHGKDPSLFYEKAVSSFQRAIKVAPKTAKTFTNIGRLYKSRGEYEQKQGQNPRSSYEQAATNFQKAIELNPNDPYSYTNLSLLCQTRAEYEIEKGQSPQALFEQAASNLQKAIEISPKYTFAYTSLGYLYQICSDYELEHGQNPRSSLEQAIINFQKVIQLKPDHVTAHHRLGLVYQTQSEYEINHGQDPNNSFEKSIASLKKAIEVNPANTDAYNSLGYVFYSKLDQEIRCGRDPKELFTTAMSNYKKSLEINPKQLEPTLYSALLFCRQSEWQLNQLKNPTANIEQCRILLEKAITIKPKFELIYRTQAEIELVAARLAIAQKQSPDSFFAKAETALKKAIEIKADNAKTYRQMAQLALLQAQWNIDNQQDPKALLIKSLDMIDKSLTIDTNNAESQAIKGLILLTQAKVSNNQALRQQAIEMLEKAFQLNQWLKYEYEKLLK